MKILFGRMSHVVAYVSLFLVIGGMFGIASGSEETALGSYETAAAEGFTFASEGLRLVAHFADEEATIVLSDGRTFVLPQAISASGARFTDGDTEFWNKGDEAYVQLDGQSHTVRIVDPETDVWERARREGVTFRAVGQEPGWLVEIVEGRTIRLLLDYGLTELTTPLGSLETHLITGTRTYRTLAPWSPVPLAVTIENKVCYDGMSGEGFTSTVYVQLDGSPDTLVGCGRDL